MAEHLIVYRPEDWLPDGLDVDLAGDQELREAYQKHSAARTAWYVSHGSCGCQPLDRGLGFGRIIRGSAIEQHFHQHTRRRNAPRQQPFVAEQVLDDGTDEPYGVIAISTPSPLTRGVDIDDRQFRQAVTPAPEHFADLGQDLLSAVTLRNR